MAAAAKRWATSSEASISTRVAVRVLRIETAPATSAARRLIAPTAMRSCVLTGRSYQSFCSTPCRGLILVTGITGSGKSSTLAALVNHINESRACHILTIEDPIEFVHEDRKAIVSQRELGTDTVSFLDGLRGALVLAPGRYEISWDGRDDHGTRVKSGVYFVRIVTGGMGRTLPVVSTNVSTLLAAEPSETISWTT